MVKLTQIQTGQFFNLLQAVHQGIPVNKHLSGGLRDIQVVLKELINGKQGFLIQRIDRAFLENF